MKGKFPLKSIARVLRRRVDLGGIKSCSARNGDRITTRSDKPAKHWGDTVSEEFPPAWVSFRCLRNTSPPPPFDPLLFALRKLINFCSSTNIVVKGKEKFEVTKGSVGRRTKRQNKPSSERSQSRYDFFVEENQPIWGNGNRSIRLSMSSGRALKAIRFWVGEADVHLVNDFAARLVSITKTITRIHSGSMELLCRLFHALSIADSEADLKPLTFPLSSRVASRSLKRGTITSLLLLFIFWFYAELRRTSRGTSRLHF